MTTTIPSAEVYSPDDIRKTDASLKSNSGNDMRGYIEGGTVSREFEPVISMESILRWRRIVAVELLRLSPVLGVSVLKSEPSTGMIRQIEKRADEKNGPVGVFWHQSRFELLRREKWACDEYRREIANRDVTAVPARERLTAKATGETRPTKFGTASKLDFVELEKTETPDHSVSLQWKEKKSAWRVVGRTKNEQQRETIRERFTETRVVARRDSDTGEAFWLILARTTKSELREVREKLTVHRLVNGANSEKRNRKVVEDLRKIKNERELALASLEMRWRDLIRQRVYRWENAKPLIAGVYGFRRIKKNGQPTIDKVFAISSDSREVCADFEILPGIPLDCFSCNREFAQKQHAIGVSAKCLKDHVVSQYPEVWEKVRAAGEPTDGTRQPLDTLHDAERATIVSAAFLAKFGESAGQSAIDALSDGQSLLSAALAAAIPETSLRRFVGELSSRKRAANE